MSIISVAATLVIIFKCFCLNNTAVTYTTLKSMEKLLPTLNVIHQTLSHYIDLQETQLYSLKRYASYINDELEKSSENPEEYLFNPINDYILIKRLTADWNTTKALMFDSIYSELNNIMKHLGNVRFPKKEQLDEISFQLIKLQETYHLNTESIARGELNGIQTSSEMTSDDCFQLGKAAYDEEHYDLMYSWMMESLLRYKLNESSTAVQKWEILDYLSLGSYLAGDNAKALDLTYNLLALHPELKQLVKDTKLYQLNDNDDKLYEKVSQVNIKDIKSEPEKDNSVKRYKQLCSGQIQLPVNISSQLRCRYVNYGNPYLFLAPLKEEEALLNPRILLFRNVLHPSEIKLFKDLHNIHFTKMYNDSVNFNTYELARIDDSEHPTIQKVLKRVADMSSLNVETVEKWHLINYGIGGQYTPHYDHIFDAAVKNPNGRRIATLLIGMNNVKQGGATVFPLVDLAVQPEEGTAVFWFNLHNSGETDHRSLHAGCSVLKGQKWVVLKVFHEKGQELIRPCDPIAV